MSKIIFIIIVAIVIVGAIYYEKRRSDGLSTAAKKLGLDYQSGQQSLPQELDAVGFDLFTQGAPNIRNRLQGFHNGREISMFEFTYTASSAGEGQREVPVADDYKSIENRSQSVIWIRSQSPLPDFDLSPSKLHRRTVGERFGLHQLTLDGENEFNRSHTLLVRDSSRVRDLFGPQVLQYLQRNPKLVVESRGRDTLIYRFEHLTDPAAVAAFIQEAEELSELLQP